MRTLRARPALLASLMVGVVAMMGLGFALWAEQLHVGATVNTGTLNMRFSAVSANEVADNAADDAICQGAGVAANGNSATVTFTNAFPGYSCIIATTVRNVGTVDATLQPVAISGDVAPFDIQRLLLADDPVNGGATDGDLIPHGVGTRDGPAWRVTFKTDNDNTTENHTGASAYHLTFSAPFENAAP